MEFLNVVWRTLVIFVLLMVLSRAMGRKFLSEMTFFDFVTAITIGTIAAAFVVSAAPGFWVLLSPVVMAGAAIATGSLNYRSLTARTLIKGDPVVVIQNGKILENNMRRVRYNLDDLEMQLREKRAFNISQVEFAVLEPDGKLSLLKKTPYRPITPHDLRVPTGYEGVASEIIKDGHIIEQNLRQNNLDFGWLYNELRNRNVDRISDVTLASLQTDGTLYVDLTEDKLKYVQKPED